MPTIKDVAREAGVSIATVSYVLNNRHDMVGEQTRQHVLDIAAQLGYRPNIVARNLQASRTSLIGYAWHTHPSDHPHSVMDQFIYHLAQAAESHNYHLLTFTHPHDDPIGVYADLIKSGRVDGFALAETTHNDPRIAYLIEQKFPFVSFGRTNPDWDFHWLDTDGRAGMRLATDYLISLGHQRIAFLGWPVDSLSGNDRLTGYIEALQAGGLAVREDYILHNDYAQNSIERIFTYWQSLPMVDRPTAIVAISDHIAATAMRTAERFGLRIGENLSLIGFDDAPFVRYLRPELTTVRQQFALTTSLLMSRLDALIQGQVPQHKTELIEPELVIRESTAPPPTES